MEIEPGDDIILTCSVILPSEVTDTPRFKWKRPNVATYIVNNPSRSFGQVFVSEYTVNNIATYQAGMYSCFVDLHGSIFTDITISIESNKT